MDSLNDGRSDFESLLINLDGHTVAELRMLDSSALQAAVDKLVEKTADPARTKTSCSNATGAN